MRRAPMLLLATVLLPFLTGADNTGCASQSSSDVNQDTIHTTYWLYYDSNADATYARAQFRFGSAVGTTLVLEPPAEVSFNGQPMGFNELLDWHEVVLAGQVTGTFRYQDAEGRGYDNAVSGFAEADLPSIPSTISSTASYTLTWIGTPLVADELMETVVASAANGFDFNRWDQRTPGATTVILTASGLSSVANGPAKLSIRRHRDLPLDEQPGAGGKITTTYQPIDRAFNLQ